MKTSVFVSLILAFVIVVVKAEVESGFGLPQLMKKWNIFDESDSDGTLAPQRQKRCLFRHFKDYSRNLLGSTNKFIRRTFGSEEERSGRKSAAPTSPTKETKKDSAAKTSATQEPKDTDAPSTTTIENEVTTTTN